MCAARLPAAGRKAGVSDEELRDAVCGAGGRWGRWGPMGANGEIARFVAGSFIKQYLGAPSSVDMEAIKSENEFMKKKNEELKTQLEEVTKKVPPAPPHPPHGCPTATMAGRQLWVQFGRRKKQRSETCSNDLAQKRAQNFRSFPVGRACSPAVWFAHGSPASLLRMCAGMCARMRMCVRAYMPHVCIRRSVCVRRTTSPTTLRIVRTSGSCRLDGQTAQRCTRSHEPTLMTHYTNLP